MHSSSFQIKLLVKELVAVMSCFDARQVLCVLIADWTGLDLWNREGWKPVKAKGIMYMLKAFFELHYYKAGAEGKW